MGQDEKFKRDRDGEIFENDLTEEDEASPVAREKAAHEENLSAEDTDSEAADRFMRDHYEKK